MQRSFDLDPQLVSWLHYCICIFSCKLTDCFDQSHENWSRNIFVFILEIYMNVLFNSFLGILIQINNNVFTLMIFWNKKFYSLILNPNLFTLQMYVYKPCWAKLSQAEPSWAEPSWAEPSKLSWVELSRSAMSWAELSQAKPSTHQML